MRSTPNSSGLYWELGELITEKQRGSGWGDAVTVIDQVARDFTRELGGLKGFSRSNLYYIRQWYRFYEGQGEFVEQAVRQIPWGHNLEIIKKIKDPEKALW